MNTSSFDSPTCLEVRSQSWQLIAMIHVHVRKTHKAEGSLAQKMMDMVTFPETSLSHLPGSKAFFEKNKIKYNSCLPFIPFLFRCDITKSCWFQGRENLNSSQHASIGSTHWIPVGSPGGPRHLQTDFGPQPVAEKAPEISPKRMGFKEISRVFVNGFQEISYRCVLNCFQRGTPLIHGSGIFT